MISRCGVHMKCILHIGTEKTGTTSLQKYFAQHRDTLLERRIFYPRSLGGHWHRYLSVFAMPSSRPDDEFESLGLSTPKKHTEFRIELEKRFAAEFKAVSGVDFCLISSEHLHSRLHNEEEISSVLSFLSPYFNDFTILVHLRPQIDVLVSLASTVARGNRVVDCSFFMNANMKSMYYDYHALLSAWGNVFGKGNIVPVSFKRKPRMVDFISALLGTRFDDLGLPGRENSALDVEVIALLNAVKRKGIDTRRFGGVINDLPFRNGINVGRSLARHIQTRCSESNEKVALEFDEINMEDLEPDYSRYDGIGNLDILDAPCRYSNAVADFFERSRKVFAANEKLRRRLKE